MSISKFENKIRTSILGEFMDKDGNVSVMYIEYKDSSNELIAGTATNIGLIKEASIIYDNDFHIDANIEALCDKLEELGYERIN